MNCPRCHRIDDKEISMDENYDDVDYRVWLCPNCGWKIPILVKPPTDGVSQDG